MKKIILILLLPLMLCLCAGSYAVYKIFQEINEVAAAERLSEEFEKYSPADCFENGLTYEEIFFNFKPDLAQLKNINADVAGWLYIPQTNINYPLLQGKDNSFYLTHNAGRKYSAAGSLFVDVRGTDAQNVIIYGHNMGTSSSVMFHDITKFEDRAFFENNSSGYIITDFGVVKLNIFAYSLTKPQSGFYNDSLELNFVEKNSLNYRTPSSGDKMYTLSTCAYDYADARAVLSCMAQQVYYAEK